MDGYEPEAGDLIWTDFDPHTGREQGGRRPALVLSPAAFWRATRMSTPRYACFSLISTISSPSTIALDIPAVMMS